ncbi:hypothetical protein EJ02DRAFT_496004 [Clathrospora elynae]|uniref:Uncharacterized protein n=1 Tax=Clathrospora elynae TaxID=706981 RepID=A0A6A5SGW2_9PLEO|nr:hypothetical protein EJ02DRAFT_496004 [Clathrospora elynae]
MNRPVDLSEYSALAVVILGYELADDFITVFVLFEHTPAARAIVTRVMKERHIDECDEEVLLNTGLKTKESKRL